MKTDELTVGINLVGATQAAEGLERVTEAVKALEAALKSLSDSDAASGVSIKITAVGDLCETNVRVGRH